MSTDKKDKYLNVPTLRFPGFTDEWQTRLLGDDCNILMCKRIFSNQTSEDGEIPFFKIGTIGGIPDAFISRELFNEYKNRYNFPNKGDVMVTCAGTVGRTIVFDGEDSYFQDSNIVWISNPKQIVSNTFLYYIISKIDWGKLNTTTIVRIYNDDLRNQKISFPKDKNEQEKIVHLLRLLDERIATQNKIIERLESLITGLEVELIGKHKPNIRLSDLVTCHSSILQENQLEEFGNYPAYGANGISGYSDYAMLNVPSILIVKDGSGVGTLKYVQGEYSVIGTLNYLIPKNESDLRYIYFALKAFDFSPFKTGMAIPHIYFRDYGKSKIYFPNAERRISIVKALTSVEHKISVESDVLAGLVYQKNYLMQSLFI